MKVVHKNQTQEFKNSDKCVAIEYPLGDKDINGDIIKLHGRYPEKGRVVNTVCKELSYILKGQGKVFVEDKEIKLEKGDLILIEANERYYFDGNLEMFVPCVPAWYPEQHKQVD